MHQLTQIRPLTASNVKYLESEHSHFGYRLFRRHEYISTGKTLAGNNNTQQFDIDVR
jgi:hypothetical protein